MNIFDKKPTSVESITKLNPKEWFLMFRKTDAGDWALFETVNTRENVALYLDEYYTGMEEIFKIVRVELDGVFDES